MSNIKQVEVPSLGESVSEASIAVWHKQVGEAVATDELLVELETDKVTLEVNAPVSGKVTELKFAEGDTVNIGDLLALIEEGAQGEDPKENKKEAASPSSNTGNNTSLSPAPRKMVADNGLDAGKIAGTGKDGRVTKGDVINALQNPVANSASEIVTNEKPVERVKMSRLRQKIAERLKDSQNTAAILSTFNEIDMSSVIDFRTQYKDKFMETHGVKLGFMSFFVKAVVEALKAVPSVNAEIEGTDLIYKNFYDIAVAVGTPQGLVVPVLRNCDKLSLAGIEQGIMDLAIKAKDGKLTMKDLQGGSFTVSNGGVYGSLLSTPIINPPQAGILGMHKTQPRPVAIDGKVEIRPMMYIALSYDHRIIDGKEAVTFLVKVKEAIEDPKRMLLGV